MNKIIDKILILSKKNWFQFLLFLGILWLVFVHLHINRHLTDMIIGPHFWRKSDTYSQIMNYYYNGLNFFDHSYYYNLFDSNGKAVGEFPIFYYFIALQLKLIGNYSIIIKINWLVLTFIGLFSLFKICYHFLHHFWLSIYLSTLFFLSPIYSYYFLSYLPDPVSLNLMLLGLYLLINPSKKRLISALFIIGVAGMIKPFFMIPFIAYVLVLIFNQLIHKDKALPKINFYYVIPFLLVAIWFFYVSWYNHKQGSNLFLSSPHPIWSISQDIVDKTIRMITKRWFYEYLNPSVLYLLLFFTLVNLIWWNKKTVLLNLFYIFNIVGSLFFVLLFFNMFEHHDYYVFPLLFILPLTFGIFIYKLLQLVKNKGVIYSFTLGLLLMSYFQMDYSWDKNEYRRKTPWISEKYKYEDYKNLDYFLNKNNIHQNDLVITFSDFSPSYALALLNRKGWSGYQIRKSHYAPLEKMIKNGANTLIINKRFKMSEEDSIYITPYMRYPIDDTSNIFLYDLKPYIDKNK